MDAPKGFWSELKEKWLHSGDLIAECKDSSLGRCKLHKQTLLLLSKEKWILDQTNIFIAVLGCKWEFWTGYLPEFARARNKQVSAGCQRKLFLLNAFLFPSCWDVNWNFWIQQNEINSSLCWDVKRNSWQGVWNKPENNLQTISSFFLQWRGDVEFEGRIFFISWKSK